MTKWLRGVLWLVAAVGFGVAWWRYPEENQFSIPLCTILFLGSPVADRNPDGWRWYQVGMYSLVVLLGGMSLQRHRNFLPKVGSRLRTATAISLGSFALVLASVWIVDTDEYRMVFVLARCTPESPSSAFSP